MMALEVSMMFRFVKLIIEMTFWTVVAVVALAVVGGCLALGLAPLFGWLSPVIVTFLVFLIAQVIRTFRRRRGMMALSYLEQAVRLNLPLPRMIYAAERSEARGLARRLGRLRHQLMDGHSVADALADAVPEIPARPLATVGAAERVGRLQQGLRRVLDEDRALAARMIGRVHVYRAYPLVMLLMIAAMTTLISIFVMPKYEQIFQDFAQPLPPITVTTMQVAQYAAPALLIFSGVAMLLLLGGLFWEALHPQSMKGLASVGLLDRFWWHLPFWHGMQRDEGLADVCALMSDAFTAGMPAERALAEASRLRINTVLRGRVGQWGRASRRARRSGRPLLRRDCPGWFQEC